MKLTKEEKAMLAGAYGEGTSLAMKVLVAIGEAYDAPYMVPVTRTHGLEQPGSGSLVCANVWRKAENVCRVRPTVNPSFNWRACEEFTKLEAEDLAIVKRTHAAYTKLGAIMTYDCTPYLERNAALR